MDSDGLGSDPVGLFGVDITSSEVSNSGMKINK
jgi:hypothetical protein